MNMFLRIHTILVNEVPAASPTPTDRDLARFSGSIKIVPTLAR